MALVHNAKRKRKSLTYKSFLVPSFPLNHQRAFSKLLICRVLAAASKAFTVTFTVKVPGTSIGAGLRAIRPKVTFRDLSTSIDSDDGCQRYRRPPVPVG